MTDRASNPAPAIDGCVESGQPAAGVPANRSWFTPREVATERRVRVSKVMTWIRSGELEAINHASNCLGPPRWKISADALARFDAARSSRAMLIPTARRARRGKGIAVKEYFD